MISPEIVTIDTLIFLGRLYEWLSRRKVHISILTVIAVLLVSANIGFIIFNWRCDKTCPSTDCIAIPISNASQSSSSPPTGPTTHSSPAVGKLDAFVRGDARLCCSFSRIHIVKICAKIRFPATLPRGYTYSFDGIMYPGNKSLHIVPIILYPSDVPFPMPSKCLDECISQSTDVLDYLDNVRQRSVAGA